MLFFSNDKDYKNVASGLRRELTALGITAPSHNQMLEAVAKSMGHKSYAAMLASQPAQTAPVAKAAEPVMPPGVKPVRMWGFNGERKYLQELAKYSGYRLFNDDGSLDLAAEGDLVEGIDLGAIAGTSDDILNCTAGITGASRDSSGELDPSYEGSTAVNWDEQTTKVDTRGVKLYVNANCDDVPADTLIIVPDDFASDGDDVPNLLNEELVDECELPVREVLVDACKRWLVDSRLVAKALEEMEYDSEWGGFTGSFAENADAIGEPGTKEVTAIGAAQWVAGFAMHVREFKALREELLKLS